MSEPRLTIGIPTFNRPERLQRAIASAMAGQLPVKVIVADDGDGDQCEQICNEWKDHPHFSYRKSPVTKLWHNWKWVAQQAAAEGAEFFMWLQDDDLIAPRLPRRVIRAFDQCKDCTVYCSRLSMAYDNMYGCSWVGNWGPKIPLDLLWGGVTSFPGKLLTPIAYFDSWAMAPAKAFRCGPVFDLMLESLPDDCDMFTERLDIAFMGLHGNAIADPAMAGYWMIHGRNESHLTGDTCEDQVKSAFAYLDTLMDHIPTWRDELTSWMSCLGTPDLIHSLWKGIVDHRGKSPYCDQILDLFESVLLASGKITASDTQPKAKAGRRLETLIDDAKQHSDVAIREAIKTLTDAGILSDEGSEVASAA